MPVIGFLSSGSVDDARASFGAFHQGLKEAGYVEGQNVAIEYRWADGQFDRLPAMAADLVRRRVAVIATLAALSRRHWPQRRQPQQFRSSSIVGEDPVKLGLVASLNRPGGNATGINTFTTELEAKRLGLLRELVPAATRVAVLVNPANATNTETTRETWRRPLALWGCKSRSSTPAPAASSMQPSRPFVRERPDALFVGRRPVFRQAGACNLPTWRRAMRSPRHIRTASMPKRAG